MDYSALIPVYNEADTIVEAIASIQSQSIAPREIIVVDDGSEDDTVAKLEGLPITLIRQSNQGPGAATTAAIAQARTPFIAMLDADDLWLADKIACQARYLEAHAETTGVFGQFTTFRTHPSEADFSKARPGWLRSTLLMKTDIARSIGPIVDPQGRAEEMIDWFARLREQGHRLDMLNTVVALRRIRPGSLTYQNSGLAQSYLQVAHAALLRRRAATKKDDV